MNVGKFVISLDFELHWGFFDVRPLDSCRKQLANVETVINNILQISEQYNVGLTFATVGFLFAEDKAQLSKFLPKIKPRYDNDSLNAYSHLENIDNENEPYYFAKYLVSKIKNDGRHEIGTHTFSHYYCYDKGQDDEAFKADIKAAINIANESSLEIKSIVFPRNQVNKEYLQICEELGLTTYRGNTWFNFNNDKKQRKLKDYAMRASRIIDTFINFSGSNTFSLEDCNPTDGLQLVNIPASRFLRPYNPQLKSLEKLKINRIKKGMTHAAKHNKVYHLWWHPHNFANNIEENFKNLESIYKHYDYLNNEYGFESVTMNELAEEFQKSNAV